MGNTKPRQPCCFDGCERPRASREGYCHSHHRQWKKHGEVWEFGDRERWSQIRKDAWSKWSDEAKAANVARLVSHTKGKPRSAEHSRRISESNKARWQQGGPDFAPRICRGCEAEFVPHSGNHWYCDDECKAARRRLRIHGITNRQYLNMLDAQGGTCALCHGGPKGFSTGRFGLVVDHCHETGQVRGLLCADCNTALGRFGDDADRLRAAADYIDQTCPH